MNVTLRYARSYLMLVLISIFSILGSHAHAFSYIGKGKCPNLIKSLIIGRKVQKKTSKFKETAKKVDKALDKFTQAISTHFKKRTLPLRKGVLESLLVYNGDSKELLERYSKAVTEAWNDNLISENELEGLFSLYNEKRYYLRWKDAKIVVGDRNADSRKPVKDILTKIIEKVSTRDSVKQDFLARFSHLNIGPIEWDIIRLKVKFPRNANPEDLVRLRDYLGYVSLLREKDFKKGISGVDQLFAKRPKNPIVKDYNKLQHKVKRYKGKTFHRELKRIEKQFPDEAGPVREEMALQKAARKTRSYKAIKYACSVGKRTANQRKIAKRTVNFFVGANTAIYALTYTQKYWDRKKDSRWFLQLGWDLTLAALARYFSTKILTNPGSSFSMKNWKSYLFSQGFYIIPNYVYGKLFAVSREEIQKRLRELKQGPQFGKKLIGLVRSMEEHGTLDDYRSALTELVNKKIGEKKDSIILSIKQMKPKDVATLYLLFNDKSSVKKMAPSSEIAQKIEIDELAWSYSNIFGVPFDAALRTIEGKISSRPDILDQVAQFENHIDESGIIDNYKREFVSLVGKTNNNTQALGDKALEQLGPDDFNSEALNDFLTEAISQKIYWERDVIIKTGNIGTDLYLFYTLFLPFKLPVETALALVIHNQIICQYQNHPRSAFAASFVFFVIYKYLTSLGTQHVLNEFSPPLLNSK